MAQKTTKKTATKKTVAKKTTTKTVAKKQPAKRIVTPSVAPVMQTPECGCCHHCCCHGHRFIGAFIKIIILCIVFLLGCVSAPWVMRHTGKAMMHHVQFNENGCVVLESVKCPKMLEVLSTADDNADGCISKVEFKTAMHELHKAPMKAPEPAEAM